MSTDGEVTVERLIAGRYRLIGKLGEGGFGSVYRARDTLLERDVAIKLLGTRSERFLREARAMARLHHPNIVAIHDAGDDTSGQFLVLEVVGGRSLSALMDKPMEPGRVSAIVAQVAIALGAAHDLGIVHRDIKPANILIDDADHVKVTDFGIARMTGDQQISATGGLVGTPRYMAPEQLQGEEVTSATDLFALGIVAYELLTGESPFAGATASEIAANILIGNRRTPAPEVVARAPRLWAVINRLLEHDPARRGTALQIGEDLHGPLPVARQRRKPTLPFFIALAAAVLIAVGVLVVGLRHPEPAKFQRLTVHLRNAKASDILDFVEAPVRVRAGRVSMPGAVARDTRKGDLAGVLVTARRSGVSDHDIEIEASPEKLAAAKEAVAVVDALAGYRFKSEPNLFTGSKPSTRRISSSSTIRSGHFIDLVAHAAGWPLVQDNSVKQVATTGVPVALNNVPWDEAVRNVINTVGLALWQDGEIWILESQQRRREREQTAPRSWVSFALHRRDHAAVVDSLRPLLSERGAVALSPRTGLIIVFDTAERLQALRSAVFAMDPDPSRSPQPLIDRRYTGERGSLNLADADLVQLLQLFSNYTGLSTVIDPSIRGRLVTVNLPAVPWDNSLDAILVSQGLSYSVQGDVMTVYPESKVYSGPMVERTLHLQHERPTFFRAFEKAMASQREEIVLADDASGTLILRGASQVVEPTVMVFRRIDELEPMPARFR